MASFLKEAEAKHPELLELPDDIEICEKAAGYENLSRVLSSYVLRDV